MLGKWWQRPDAIVAGLTPLAHGRGKECYCFGRCLLVMECEDHSFSRRFKDLFAECAFELTGSETLPRVDFRLSCLASDPGLLAVSMVPSPLDGASFIRQLLPERRYLECSKPAHGWRMLALPEAPEEPVLAFGSSDILVSDNHPWQRAIAMHAISTAFRMQPDVFVFHAASIGLLEKGVLLCGPKGAGKTTLSLCFAARGHAFLGDEWAVVSALTGELLPLRRSASIRPGPRPSAIEDYLSNHSCNAEVLADGTERVHARVGAIFPSASAKVVPLTHIFFLRRFAPRPSVERFVRNGGELPPVSPLLASVWGHSVGQRAIDLFRTLDKAHWWHLDVGGSPEETAKLVEETVREDIWG